MKSFFYAFRLNDSVYLFAALIVVSTLACDGQNVDKVAVALPQSIVNGRQIYIGQQKDEILSRGSISKSEIDEWYVEKDPSTKFSSVSYLFESDELSAVMASAVNLSFSDFRALMAVCERQFGVASRRQTLTDGPKPAVARIWKVSPECYAWVLFVKDSQLYSTVQIYVGPHADWNGLPEW